MDLVEQMKREAEALDPKFCTWRDNGERMITCRMNGGKHQWRDCRSAYDRGPIISEQVAHKALLTDGPWHGPSQ